MKKIFITGGNGMIGSAIIAELSQRYEIVVLDKFDSNIEGRAEVIKEDLCDVAQWKSALRNVYCVMHLAAAVHSRPRTLAEEAEFIRVNTTATRALFEACAEMGVSRVLFFSTNSVYPDSKDPLDENAPIVPQGVYGSSKYEAELAARELAIKGLPICIFRPASVFGRLDRGSMRSLVALCKKGFVPVVGGGNNGKAMTYVQDIALAAAKYVDSEDAYSGEVFNIASGNYTFNDMLDAISEAYSLKPLRIPIPGFLCAPPLRALPPINLLAIAASCKVINIDKMRNVLGYSPQYDLVKGLRDCRDFYLG